MNSAKLQKKELLFQYVSALSEGEAKHALFNVLCWQILEIGEDMSFIHPKLGHDYEDDPLPPHGRVYWSSCGDSILEEF